MQRYLWLTLMLSATSHAELMLFGGSEHDEFLGCLDCSEYDSDSICNEYGSHGNEYSTYSIWNEYATYGSEYSSSSPWNEYTSSTSVPVLVDRAGNFYGYFTINEYRSKAFDNAAQLKRLFEIAEGDLSVVQNMFCN